MYVRPIPSQRPCTDDRPALHSLFLATGGPSNAWRVSLGWNAVGMALDEWYGVQVSDGRVVHLNLIDNKMSGSIPSEFYNLPYLSEMRITQNSLSGPILPQVGNLTSLTRLVLRSNGFDGNIPAALGLLVKLTDLNLSKNNLQGTIPEALGSLTEMKTLILSNNKLEGTVPLGVWKLPYIQLLDLSSNFLTEFTDAAEKMASAKEVLGCLGRATLVLTRDNPWEFPPAAVAIKGPESLRKYYETWEQCDFRLDEIRALKVVFIGAAAAGKTSLSRSIQKGRGDRTPEVVESRRTTVGVDLHTHTLQAGTECKIYDVAGQITYYGLHQFFLTERAVYVLVWDATTFAGLNEADLDKAVEDNMLEWVSLLHMRTPLCTVLLVASHCDVLKGTTEEKKQLLATVERRFLDLHKRWRSLRHEKIASMDGRMTILPGVLPVGCRLDDESRLVDYAAEDGLQAVDNALSRQKSVISRVPPSWTAARRVLEEMGSAHCDSDRKATSRRPWELRAHIHEVFKKYVEEDHRSPVGQQQAFLTDLKPQGVHDSMEGAIEMRAFSGTLISHDIYVVLDVMWLAGVLKPILDHRDTTENDWGQEIFADRVLRTPSLQSGREDLVNRAILRQDFARFLWNLEDQQEVKQAALQSILVEIGVAIPLPLDENRNGIEAAESKEEPHPGQEQDGSPSDDDSGDLLVIMRLQAADATTQANLEGARAAYDRGSNRTKRRILKAMFKFDHGGAPHGLPERVMALCHKIGMLSPGARWRLGGLFILHERLQPEENDEHKHCAVIVEYDKKLKVLSIEALGQSEREFEALRFVISAVFHIARDFPGVGWTAWLECGMAHGEKMYHLATSYGKEDHKPGSWIVPLMRRSPTDAGTWQHNLCPQNGVAETRSCTLVPRRFDKVLDVKQPYPPQIIVVVASPADPPAETLHSSTGPARGVGNPLHREGFGIIVGIMVSVLGIGGGTVLGFGLDSGNATLWGLGVTLLVVLMFVIPFVVACYYRMCCWSEGRRSRIV